MIFSCRGGSVRCLHFALRDYYAVKCCTASAQNGVKIAAVGDVTAGIDCHAVPEGQQCPCRGPGTGGGVAEASRDARDSKNRFRKEITVHFGRNQRQFIVNRQSSEMCTERYVSPNLKNKNRFGQYIFFISFFICPRASPLCNLRRIAWSESL